MSARVTEAATTARRTTENDLRATPRDGRKYELVDGEIVAEDVLPGFRCSLAEILK
jgi:hypothetical protein